MNVPKLRIDEKSTSSSGDKPATETIIPSLDSKILSSFESVNEADDVVPNKDANTNVESTTLQTTLPATDATILSTEVVEVISHTLTPEVSPSNQTLSVDSTTQKIDDSTSSTETLTSSYEGNPTSDESVFSKVDETVEVSTESLPSSSSSEKSTSIFIENPTTLSSLEKNGVGDSDENKIPSEDVAESLVTDSKGLDEIEETKNENEETTTETLKREVFDRSTDASLSETNVLHDPNHESNSTGVTVGEKNVEESSSTESSSSSELPSVNGVIDVTEQSVPRDSKKGESLSNEDQSLSVITTSFPPTDSQTQEPVTSSSQSSFDKRKQGETLHDTITTESSGIPEKEVKKIDTHTTEEEEENEEEGKDTGTIIENVTEDLEVDELVTELNNKTKKEAKEIKHEVITEASKTQAVDAIENDREESTKASIHVRPTILPTRNPTTRVPEVPTTTAKTITETTTFKRIPETTENSREVEKCPTWYSFIPKRNSCELSPLDSFRKFWTSLVPRYGPHRFWGYFWGRR
jgi:hypothetical protein